MNRRPRRLRLLLALLLLTAFTLVTLDYRTGRGGPVGGLRSAAGDVFGPVESGLSGVFRPVGNLLSDVGHAPSRGSQVRSLQQQVADLRAQLRTGADAAASQQQLDQLLGFAAGQSFAVVPAQVVGLGDASGFAETVDLDAGTADGVRPGMTVIAGRVRGGGLVGYVVSAGPHTATVATIVDPSVHVGARLARGRQFGIAGGHGRAPLTFTPADPTVRPVPGDLVQTFGSGSYPAGIPIGTVTSVAATAGASTVTAQVTPLFSYDALDVVGVVVVPATGSAPRAVVPTVTVTASPGGG